MSCAERRRRGQKGSPRSAAGAHSVVLRRAPEARNKVARGKREARGPWKANKMKTGLKGRQKWSAHVCRPSGARALSLNDPGAACSASVRTGPWITHKKLNPGGPAENSGAYLSPLRGWLALLKDPGAACSLRFALAPGYLLAAPFGAPDPLLLNHSPWLPSGRAFRRSKPDVVNIRAVANI